MTLKKPDGNDGTANDILRVAVEHFEQAILEIDTKKNQMLSGENITITDAIKTARNLTEVSKAFLIEKQKIEKSIKTQDGIVYDFAIDFAKAREEIRRRMARLRTAANSGDVSE